MYAASAAFDANKADGHISCQLFEYLKRRAYEPLEYAEDVLGHRLHRQRHYVRVLQGPLHLEIQAHRALFFAGYYPSGERYVRDYLVYGDERVQRERGVYGRCRRVYLSNGRHAERIAVHDQVFGREHAVDHVEVPVDALVLQSALKELVYRDDVHNGEDVREKAELPEPALSRRDVHVAVHAVRHRLHAAGRGKEHVCPEVAGEHPLLVPECRKHGLYVDAG